MTYYLGGSANLSVQFYEYSGGPAATVTNVQIKIEDILGNTVIATTSSGVTSLATGLYAYTWSISDALDAGQYTVIWTATDAQSEAVQTSEFVTVTSSTPTISQHNIWYATREAVKSALDSAETARNNAQVDRAIESASRLVEGFLHRKFYPEEAIRYFSWPNSQGARAWRLWLDADEVVSVTTLTSGGTTIPAANYFLEPVNVGPPYQSIEIDLDSSSAFSAGDTFQRSVAVTGVFGYSAEEAAAGTCAEVLDASETGVDVSDSSLIGVGDIIKIDSEWMIVTGKSMLTTAQTLQTPMTAAQNNVTVAVTNGAAYAVGEVVLLDSERMLIVDIAGNNLTVKRAYDGSVLAAHTGSTLYAPRTLTVERGALGTTAATHNTSSPITRHVVPALVRNLVIAEAINMIQQETSGYARVVGSGDNSRESYGRGLMGIRTQAYTAYGRKARTRAV